MVRTNLSNPDSRVDLLARKDAPGELLLAYNPSTTKRSPLVLARTITCGESWSHVTTLYEGHASYPTMAQVGNSLVTTFTRDGKGVGIGAAATELPPPLGLDPRAAAPDVPREDSLPLPGDRHPASESEHRHGRWRL
jgi:hypothetical protein